MRTKSKDKGHTMKIKIFSALLDLDETMVTLLSFIFFSFFASMCLLAGVDIELVLIECVLYGLSLLFTKIFYFKAAHTNFVNSLEKHIKELYKEREFINEVISDICITLNYNTKTIGFWICDKNNYKGEIAQNYLKFVKEKFTLKALEMLDEKERYSQKIRQERAKRDYEYNKKQTQINQSIDSLFGNLQKDTQ